MYKFSLKKKAYPPSTLLSIICFLFFSLPSTHLLSTRATCAGTRYTLKVPCFFPVNCFLYPNPTDLLSFAILYHFSVFFFPD